MKTTAYFFLVVGGLFAGMAVVLYLMPVLWWMFMSLFGYSWSAVMKANPEYYSGMIMGVILLAIGIPLLLIGIRLVDQIAEN